MLHRVSILDEKICQFPWVHVRFLIAGKLRFWFLLGCLSRGEGGPGTRTLGTTCSGGGSMSIAIFTESEILLGLIENKRVDDTGNMGPPGYFYEKMY
jgi:hypothetical protein